VSIGSDFLREARAALVAESRAILTHPFNVGAAEGTLPIEAFQVWCRQQYPILRYDTRSIGHMMTRAEHGEEKAFFTMLLHGALGAEERLEACAAELGIGRDELLSSELMPMTQAYGHYIAWLALYGNAGEQAAALTVNLPTYASVMARLGKASKEHYGFEGGGYFELWALGLDYIDDPADAFAPPAWEELATQICGRYAPLHRTRMMASCRMQQSYELAFWDANYAAVTAG
jgi:thiaminase/transcriptional activator TenA